ncbi:glucose 1-dehydrogenase [Phenylobacterium sp. LjRoot225]|uniref:SDR family NAD(P)-dependent oxidoreductase n=1 Tax=Phenylobacterium sp. LjRoot225 TaxID=3342285 RepID=UPI003ECD21FB
MPEPTRYGGRLEGKVAIVTGAGAEGEGIGIGRAIATVLAGEGARVCCADLDLARAQATAERIGRTGGAAFAVAGDVSQAGDCERLVAETVSRHGRLDVLVNNVGISPPTRLDSFDEALWSRVFDVNLKSAVLMSRYAVPAMTAGGGGAIINISSIAGMRAHGSLAYGASKAAMAQLSREIAAAYGRAGIRANTVAPGHVMTSHVEHLMAAEMRETRRKVGPLGIEGDAWDVAAAVTFLASDEARFITGVELPVDGGVTAIAPLAAHGLIMGG